MTARRQALDHVLALSAGAFLRDRLVLRGSMAMLGLVGDAARDPGDLDWVVRPFVAHPVDRRDPYPYLDRLDRVQHWPEAVHGAGRNQMWTFEEYDTGGQHPRLPPEGLYWVVEDDDLDDDLPHRDLAELIGSHPDAGGGVRFDADSLDRLDLGGYYGAVDGHRLILYWTGPDGEEGQVQLDFAYDEPILEPPAALAVPRVDGGPPTAVWAASRELSLVWKLQWLVNDQRLTGCAQGKDLYDAVLLAELPDLRIPPRLARLLPDLTGVADWRVDWALPDAGPVQGWLDRLAAAVHRS